MFLTGIIYLHLRAPTLDHTISFSDRVPMKKNKAYFNGKLKEMKEFNKKLIPSHFFWHK